jgi:hypothetical protein
VKGRGVNNIQILAQAEAQLPVTSNGRCLNQRGVQETKVTEHIINQYNLNLLYSAILDERLEAHYISSYNLTLNTSDSTSS